MKILQITLSLGTGGAERFAVDLCNRLAEIKDNEVILVTILDENIPAKNRYSEDLSPKVRCVYLKCKTGLQARALWKITTIIREEQPDIVHSHFLALPLFLPSFIYSHCKFFQTIHTMAEREKKNLNIIKWLISKYLYVTNKVKPVTISHTCHNSYVKAYKLNNDVCIINGRAALQITRNYHTIKKEIDDLKINDDTLVFIHVARHNQVKNHDRLFRTFLRLENEECNFILIILGDNYGCWQDKLRSNSHIFLLGPKTNVGDYMAQADFFVLSSDVEGLPITILEAMSMGVVPISTPAGGVVDVIEDRKNGYIAADFDDESFYQKIKQAIHEKGRISPEIIKENYEKEFSIETCATNYYNLYLNSLHV